MKLLRFLAPLFLSSVQLLAVPAWSRTTGASCNACHATPTWQLTSMGMEFLKNGHRMEALKVDPKDQKLDNYVSLVWKGRAYGDSLDTKRTGLANTQKPATNFEQHSFSLYTGGALSERFSYFTELYLNENTGNTSGANIVQSDAGRKKLAEAFIQYNQPISQDVFLAVRAGEILPGILHVFGVGARSAEQRATVLNDQLAGSTNTFRPFSRQQGMDATLVGKHFEAAFGVVDGSSTSITNSIDADNHKDWYGSFLYSLDSHHSAVGLYHYDGQFSNYATQNDFSTALSYDNKFKKDGILARFIRDNFRIVGAYFMGEETMNLGGTKTKNKGYYGLVDYNFTDSFGMYVRMDNLDPNKDLANNETTQAMLGLNGMLYQSEKSGARWNFEYTEKQSYLGGTIAAAGTTKFKDKRYFFQVTWGF
ncbi:hypothetical protein GETHLI_09100 [Geothrix limicola]|uniref:Cytochrome C n=1 Tax=Geothrix limicola TaxID=2927978 RepID=A0ABQ5QCV3_9BACT|nr:hypothetical protein [Geothrix limicola]GLH72408.1 hypothetical protein GETHLI_09100 [Geothrix limicola]